MIEFTVPLLTVAGSVGIVSASLALGFRHGIDWDHIAAITDITSTASDSAVDEDEHWLVREPGVMLTDESHHTLAHGSPETRSGSLVATAIADDASEKSSPPYWHTHDGNGHGPDATNGTGVVALARQQKPAIIRGGGTVGAPSIDHHIGPRRGTEGLAQTFVMLGRVTGDDDQDRLVPVLPHLGHVHHPDELVHGGVDGAHIPGLGGKNLDLLGPKS